MSSHEIRMSMMSLPHPFQRCLTWLTGKALPGERPLVKGSPTTQLAGGVLGLAGGVVASVLAFHAGPVYWLLLPFSWIVTVGSARKIHVNLCHQCVHYRLYGNPRVDHAIGEILSTIVLVQDFRGFRHDHTKVHHGKSLATVDDPDIKFLLQLGFRPGDERRMLWRRLARTILSPRFHALYLFYRLKANFWTCPGYRKAMAIGFHGGLLATALAVGAFPTYVVAWLFPITILQHISALLQFSCEHRWLLVREPDEPAQVYLARLTVGRFLGDPAPPPGLTRGRAALAWTVWTIKMLSYHLACRTFVLIGDLPVHDFHHRHPSSPEWPDAIYARQQDIDAGCPGWKEPYDEVWGLHNAIDAVFEIWSELGDAIAALAPLRPAEVEEVLRSM